MFWLELSFDYSDYCFVWRGVCRCCDQYLSNFCSCTISLSAMRLCGRSICNAMRNQRLCGTVSSLRHRTSRRLGHCWNASECSQGPSDDIPKLHVMIYFGPCCVDRRSTDVGRGLFHSRCCIALPDSPDEHMPVAPARARAQTFGSSQRNLRPCRRRRRALPAHGVESETLKPRQRTTAVDSGDYDDAFGGAHSTLTGTVATGLIHLSARQLAGARQNQRRRSSVSQSSQT
jgi:hypothetical protein